MKLALAFLAACGQPLAGAGLDLPFLDVVYECDAEDGTGRVLELCYDSGGVALSEALADEPGGLWSCRPTPRHLGPCVYHCDGGRGCNALNGCFCP